MATRAWFSYVVLAIGLMMLLGSDRPSSADEKEAQSHAFKFGTDKDIQVFVNKQGDDSEVIDLVINGKKINFKVPEIGDGETSTFTTDDGTKVIIKSLPNNRLVLVDGEEISLPKLHEGKLMSEEGLSSIISRVHGQKLTDFQKDTVTVSGQGLSEDARRAMVDAIQGVLTSYGIEKEVVYREKPKFEFVTSGGVHFDGGQFKVIEGGDIDIKVEADGSGQKVMVIENKVIKKKKEEN